MRYSSGSPQNTQKPLLQIGRDLQMSKGEDRKKSPLDAFRKLYTVKGDGIAELKLSRLATSPEARELFNELTSREIVKKQDRQTADAAH